ncbi:MAG: hypothetical protein QOG63_2282 [Thermoleophilaceae bacterium]|jgi:hypothetical protein|nr:hypothetical protein [Thermoleophilaceae bacterium]
MRQPSYTKEQALEAVAQAHSYSETLRLLGLRDAGGNHRTLKAALARWGVATDHFDPNAGRRRGSRSRAVPLDDILVEQSSFARSHLKERLYQAGVKKPECELCAQGPIWRGQEMSLVLDHVNGVATDNRIENLRIVCPNCAATLDTHCGRNLDARAARACAGCEGRFRPRDPRQRYCSVRCARRSSAGLGRPQARKVVRPDHSRLLHDVAKLGFRGTGRRYGVSDNAVRKWLRFYERASGGRASPNA